MKKCSCPIDSPFHYHWPENNRPSMFAKDKAFGIHSVVSSEGATQRLQDARKAGKDKATIKGISRNREAEVLRVRQFSVFSLAKP